MLRSGTFSTWWPSPPPGTGGGNFPTKARGDKVRPSSGRSWLACVPNGFRASKYADINLHTSGDPRGTDYDPFLLRAKSASTDEPSSAWP